MRAIGDLAAFMLASQLQASLRKSADTAAHQATTGLAKDKARHLGGSSMALSLLDRKAQLLEEHQRGIAELAVFASSTQTVLGKIQDQSLELAKRLSVTSQLKELTTLGTLSNSAAQVFVDVVDALNTEVAGRYLFSGVATDRPPLPGGLDLLSMLKEDLAGISSPDAAMSAINSWFNAPTGAFETMVYAGSVSGFAQRPIGPDATVVFGLRADGDTVRHLLTALATAAVASDASLEFSTTDQQTMLDQARKDLGDADRNLIEERAGVGLTEATIATSRRETDIDLNRLAFDRTSLLGVDQFEAASEFEAAQQQLDTFYRIAARQSRVSLAEYLR